MGNTYFPDDNDFIIVNAVRRSSTKKYNNNDVIK